MIKILEKENPEEEIFLSSDEEGNDIKDIASIEKWNEVDISFNNAYNEKDRKVKNATVIMPYG